MNLNNEESLNKWEVGGMRAVVAAVYLVCGVVGDVVGRTEDERVMEAGGPTPMRCDAMGEGVA